METHHRLLQKAPRLDPQTEAGLRGPKDLGVNSHDGTSHTLSGRGSNLWGTGAQDHFTCRSPAGDGEIIARVNDLANGTEEGAGGIMIQRDLSLDSLPTGFQTIHAAVNTPFGKQIITNLKQLAVIGGEIPAPEFLPGTPSSNGEISRTAVNGQTYRVEWSEDLRAQTCNELTIVIADDST